jgi:16S rRNA (guanine527-N7)-methyltransferase
MGKMMGGRAGGAGGAEGALTALAARWQVSFPETTREALLGFGRLLLDWNRRINLTGAPSLDALVSEHFPDAFAVASLLSDDAALRVADVGSGGGLPSIPLALLRPAAALTLFEPIGKKVAFLRTAIRTLGLGARVDVHSVRIGGPKGTDAARVPGSPFDVAMSRATFAPEDWLRLGAGMVGAGGRVIALSSTRIADWPAVLELLRAVDYRDGGRWVTELRRRST